MTPNRGVVLGCVMAGLAAVLGFAGVITHPGHPGPLGALATAAATFAITAIHYHHERKAPRP